MIMEGLVALSCAYGSGESCLAGLTNYATYNKLDKQAEEIGRNVKRKWPVVYHSGVILAATTQRKYNAILHRNVALNFDYSDLQDQKTVIYFKYSF